MGRKRITSDLRAEMDRRLRAGESVKAVAIALGLAPATVRLHSRLERPPRVYVTPEMRAEINHRYHAVGETVAAIAQAIGISSTAVIRHCDPPLRGRGKRTEKKRQDETTISV